jgi:2-oxoglutarate dehydrogenase E2 component (dihydrolipoamide succinyltransferase)
MTIEVRVPTLPESVTDAQLLAWQKKEGDQVRRDENLVEIETDKVVLEVPAPEDGVLEQVLKTDGSAVASEEVIAVIAPQATTATPAPEPSPKTSAQADDAAPEPRSAPPLAPAVRRLLRENDLDPGDIAGTGKGGRLTKEDVSAHLESQRPAQAEEQPPPPSPREAPAAPPPLPGAGPERAERREPMSRLRARIAERLVEAQHSAAILTTFNEIDMHAVMDLRRRHRDAFEQRHGIRLGLMSFFVKACVEALGRFPVINASIDGSDIVYYEYYDIGIAVSSPRGLVVPVLRDADRLGFGEIEAAITDFAEKARDGKLSMDELTGGTFSISNGGVFGSLLSTPIINPPQSGILGMHKIEKRPVAIDGQVMIRPMMYVALSYDHRIIDGRDAVQFLVAVKEAIEDPTRLLLGL